MRKVDVFNHFRSLMGGEPTQSELEEYIAKRLDVSRQAINKWRDIIPRGSAYELQVLTAGALVVDLDLYPRRASQREQASA